MPSRPSSYTPANWYWIVTGVPASVWSSQRVAYVPTTDQGYKAWLSAGHRPSVAGTSGQLMGILVRQWLPIIIGAGVTLTSTSTPAISGKYAVDIDSLSQASIIAMDISDGAGLPGGAATFVYFDSVGAHGPLSSTQFAEVYKALKGYIYSTQQSLADLVGGGSSTFPAPAVTIA